MRVIIAPEFYQQMLQIPSHSEDCYVRPGEYLHHMYIEGVKYIVGPAVVDCLAQAEGSGDKEAIKHLRLHKLHYDSLLADAARYGNLDGVTLLGDPPPSMPTPRRGKSLGSERPPDRLATNVGGA